MMKKILSMACIIASVMFVFSKPLVADAAGSHETRTVNMSYFLGSVSATYDWDYIDGEKITYSAGYANASGLGISAYTYMISCSDFTHKYETIVNRGVSVGGSAGGTVSGSISAPGTWLEDVFYVALTYRGHFLFSHEPDFE